MVHQITMGELFVDPGAVAVDDQDGDCTPWIHTEGASEIDTSRPTPPDEPYVISYRVSDRTGNWAEVLRRRVHVRCPKGERVCDAITEEDDLPARRLSCSINSLCDASGGDLWALYMLSGTVPVQDLEVYDAGIGTREVAFQAAKANRKLRNAPELQLIGDRTVLLVAGSEYTACPNEKRLGRCESHSVA